MGCGYGSAICAILTIGGCVFGCSASIGIGTAPASIASGAAGSASAIATASVQ